MAIIDIFIKLELLIFKAILRLILIQKTPWIASSRPDLGYSASD